MALIPRNETAQRVLEYLPPHEKPAGGYFSGSDFCIAIAVDDIAKAFTLGAQMAAQAGVEFGELGTDKIGNQTYLVFREARVSQGPDLIESRIPELPDPITPSGYGEWCLAMAKQELDYHPDDSPSEVIYASTGDRVFNDQEVAELSAIMERVFNAFQGNKQDLIYSMMMDAARQYGADLPSESDTDLDAAMPTARSTPGM